MKRKLKQEYKVLKNNDENKKILKNIKFVNQKKGSKEIIYFVNNTNEIFQLNIKNMKNQKI